MTGAAIVAAAFERSAPHVERASRRPGTYVEPDNPKIGAIVRTLWDRKGKRLRSHLTYWFGELFGLSPDRLDLYAWAAEAVHTATLLHDDVMDEADLRRGGPAAHQIYGNTKTILSGDYLLADVMDRLSSGGDREIFVLLARTMKEIVSGEVLQNDLKYMVPDSGEPFDRVMVCKTASLFRWCALVAPILTRHPARVCVEAYSEQFGRLFQLSDDVLDVLGTEEKGAWTDLKGGNLNLVTWRAVQKDPTLAAAVRNAFAQKSVDRECLEIFRSSLSVKQVVAEVRKEMKISAQACSELLGELPAVPIRSALESLPGLLVDRCS